MGAYRPRPVPIMEASMRKLQTRLKPRLRPLHLPNRPESPHPAKKLRGIPELPTYIRGDCPTDVP